VTTRYVEFHRRRGNDPGIGLRLAQLLVAAGLEVMLTDGIVDEGVLHRWEAAMARLDSAPVRPTIFAPQFTAIGRRSA
jgi:hypothetical protein